MNKLFYTLLALLMWVVLPVSAQRYVGGDISLLKAFEDNGAVYKDQNGNKIGKLLPYLKGTCGMNAMRVRLFHTPKNATSAEVGQGVIQDLPYVTALGKEIKDAGLDFMLDFHYSDTWADPSKQWTPKAWVGLSDAVLADSIYAYTKKVLQTLVAAGATPDFIQTGNEITYGMCWGDVNTSSPKKFYASNGENHTRFASLLKSAVKACREVCPQAKVILHVERTPNPTYLKQFYTYMANDQVDYDIIGLSYYSYYHGKFPKLLAAIKEMETDFPKKDIMLVEVGYYQEWQPTSITGSYDYSSTYPITPAGQGAYAKDLVDTLAAHPQVKGLFWWEMDANGNNNVLKGWYNAGLFHNDDGKACPALYTLKDFLNTSAGIEGVRPSAINHQPAAYNLQGQEVGDSYRGIVIRGGKKFIKK